MARTPVPRLGITRSLAARGITPQRPQAPAPEPSGMAQALQQLLHGVTGTARAAAQFAATHEKMQQMDDTEKHLASIARDEGIPKQFLTFGVHNAVWRNEANKKLATIDPETVKRGPNEDDTTVLHRIFEDGSRGMPDAFKGPFLEGLRHKWGQYKIKQVRLAKAKLRDDTAANLRQAVYSGDPDEIAKAQAPWNTLADEAQLSEDQKRQPTLEGARRLANEGLETRARKIAKLLPADDADRLIRIARTNRQTLTHNQIRDEEMTAVANGDSFKTAWARVEKRIETPGKPRPDDITRGQSMAIKNILHNVANERFENSFWGGVRSGQIDTPEKAKQAIDKGAEADDITEKKAASMEAQFAQGKRHSAKVAFVKQGLAEGFPIPLPAELDDALLSAQSEDSKIFALTNKNGTSPVFTGVVDGMQKQWALDYANTKRIPAQVSKRIESMIMSKDHAATGIAYFVALQTFAPEQVDALYGGMNPTAQMRASAALDKLADVPLAAMTEEARNEAVASIMPEIMDLQLADISTKDAEKAIFPKVDPATAITVLLENTLPDEITVIEKGWIWGIGGRDREIEDIPQEMIDTYRDVATRTYKANLYLGSEIAKSRAKQAALREALRIGKPTIWGDRIQWLVGGPDTTQETGAAVFRDLAQWVGKDKAKEIAETYRIAWSEARAAYVLASEVFEPHDELYKHMRDGRPVIFKSAGKVTPDLIDKTPKPTGRQPTSSIEALREPYLSKLLKSKPSGPEIAPMPKRNTMVSDSRVRRVIAAARNGHQRSKNWLLANDISWE